MPSLPRRPVQVTSRIHHDSQYDEKTCRSEQQGVVLQLERHVQIRVDNEQCRRNNYSSPSTPEHFETVKDDEERGLPCLLRPVVMIPLPNFPTNLLLATVQLLDLAF